MLYRLHDVSLVLTGEQAVVGRSGILPLLDDLSFVRVNVKHGDEPPFVLTLRRADPTAAPAIPRQARERFRLENLIGFEANEDLWVQQGASVLHVRMRHRQADAHLDEAFLAAPPPTRQRFWAAGLMTLLRGAGLFGLHAAGVSAAGDRHLLIVGPSHGGKSTLALGLVQHGCRYLSDDALLLRAGEQGVAALALRKPFSIDATAADRYAEVRLGPAGPASSGGIKRRADVHASYPDQYLPSCRPNVLVFPCVTAARLSVLEPLARSAALGRLLAQSGPALFEQTTIARQLAVLAALVRQATTYELAAGEDLLRNPAMLLDLLADAEFCRHLLDRVEDSGVEVVESDW